MTFVFYCIVLFYHNRAAASGAKKKLRPRKKPIKLSSDGVHSSTIINYLALF